MKNLKAYHIFDHNNDNMYVGFVIAEDEDKAAKKVNEQHPHFSDGETEIVWRGNRGITKYKSFGLELLDESVETVRNYANVIE